MKHFLVTGHIQVCVEAENVDDVQEKASEALKKEEVSFEDMFIELDPEYHTGAEVFAFEEARDS